MAQDPEALQVIAWLIARPKLAGALLLTLALAGWHWQDKISDWLDARKIAKLETRLANAEARIAAQDKEIADAKASAQAAQDARERNDRIVPETRARAKARVDAAPTADADGVSRAVADTAADYRAAADSVRGARSR